MAGFSPFYGNPPVRNIFLAGGFFIDQVHFFKCQVFDLLLLNRAQLRYLIVHDMRGTSMLALDQTLIKSTIHLVSSEYKSFMQSDIILTESKKASELFWNNEVFNNIPVTKRLVALSSHPTVKKLLDKLM